MFKAELPLLFAFDRYSLLMWLELGVGCILPMVILLASKLRVQRRWQVVGAPLAVR